jgi:hypothetical protein
VLKGLAKSGCQQLIDKGREFLTDEGFRIMLDELRDGCVGYQVTKLPTMAAAEALAQTIVTTRCHRAASASYFLCLLRSIAPHDDTVFLQVTSNVGKDTAIDVVMVYENGSFACTEPFFAQMGQPGRHILACFHAQFCNINVLQHYHPRYLRKFSKPKSVSVLPVNIPDLSWQDRITLGTAKPEQNRLAHRRPQFSKLTSWSWAIRRVSVRADEELLGGEAYRALLRQDPNDMAHQPEAREDRRKKARHVVLNAGGDMLERAAAFILAETKESKKRKLEADEEKQRDPQSGTALDQPPLPGRNVAAKRKDSHGGASTKRSKKK